MSSRISPATESTETLLRHHATRPGRSERKTSGQTAAHLILLLGTLLIPSRGEAQFTPLHLEVRGGVWMPAADLVGAQGFEGEASGAASFGVHFVLNNGRTSYVAGFSEHRFGCTQAQCAEAVTLVSTSWDLGVRVNLRQAGIVPWVSLGASAALFEAHVETGGGVVSEGSELTGSFVVREGSDRGWGYEVGAGFLVPVRGLLAINLAVRYGRSDVDFASRGTLETRYIIADVGLVVAF